MSTLVKDLVEAGIHFGHRSTHWNPKMTPYIFGKRNRIHIIDVKQTIKGLLLARKFITKTVSEGKDILFVGTKRQARNIIEKHVTECGMHYCTERWLGGTLTNFTTIRARLKRLEELENIEESGEMKSYSKKMESQLNREKSKIHRNLSGIRNMKKLPGAMVIIDVNAETNAVKEARKLGIPTVCLIDTDSNPEYADIPIPGQRRRHAGHRDRGRSALPRRERRQAGAPLRPGNHEDRRQRRARPQTKQPGPVQRRRFGTRRPRGRRPREHAGAHRNPFGLIRPPARENPTFSQTPHRPGPRPAGAIPTGGVPHPRHCFPPLPTETRRTPPWRFPPKTSKTCARPPAWA